MTPGACSPRQAARPSPAVLDLLDNVGLVCRIARTLRGLRQHQAATAAGISPNFLSLIENGQRLPSLRLLKTLNRVYERGISALLVHALHAFLAQDKEPPQ